MNHEKNKHTPDLIVVCQAAADSVGIVIGRLKGPVKNTSLVRHLEHAEKSLRAEISKALGASQP